MDVEPHGTATTHLAELNDLKQKGVITEQEFTTLTSATTAGASALVAKSELRYWILLVGLVVGAIFFDH